MRLPVVLAGACVAVGVLAGCSASSPPPDPVAEACGGERPGSVTDCTGGGVFYVDCDGDGDPILACHESGGLCKWFTHGCAPVGFHATACPIGNPCCESTSDGTWPFADSWRPATPMAVVELAEDIAAMGHTLVSASSPATVVVTVDPAFMPATPGASCVGPGTDVLQLCTLRLLTSTPISSADTVFARFRTGSPGGEALILEIVPGTVSGTGVPIARTFVRYEDDFAPMDVPLSCERARSPGLDLAGTLTINGVDVANPSATHGHLVLDLPAGGQASIDF